MIPSAITDEDLHAYVDNRLTQARRADVEAYLAENPDTAARLHAYSEQKAAIQAFHRDVLDEPIPHHLFLAATGLSPAPGPLSRPVWLSSGMPRRIAACFVIAGAGALGGWIGRGALRPAPSGAAGAAMGVSGLPRRAAMAHRVYSADARRPVEIGADQKRLLVHWLSKRLGTDVHPPTLAAQGYTLIGGRLLPGPHGPVAQFMYQDADGQRLTLYMSGEDGADEHAGMRFSREGQVNVYYWDYDKFGYAVSASIGKVPLKRLADAACEQLESG